jgi:UDP-glucose 4-epimerase
MRVLVTGVSGFAGAFVAKALSNTQFDVVGTYRSDSKFLAQLAGVSRITAVRADLAAASSLDGPFDAVVHAAATSPAEGVTADAMVRDNIEATRNLIVSAKKWGCSRFIFFSSISLFGDVRGPVLDETTSIVNPELYGATKYIGEQVLAAEADSLPSLSLRLPGVLGPGAHRNWLSGVAARMRAGKPVQAYNLTGPFNNAAHVEDIASLTARTLQRDWQGSDAVVLGAGGTLPVKNILERLAAGLDVSPNIVEGPSAKPSFIISSQRATERWGYRPMEIGSLVDRYAAEILADG